MAKRKRKNKTHVAPTEEDMKKYPKSFVIRSGNVGKTVAALVQDVRRIMEPHTASHLKERRGNKLKDFVAVAGQMGVTHFLIFSCTEKNTNFRICRTPRGPTLTFRVHDYALAKDCLALQKAPKTSKSDFEMSPLLVLNNFKQEGKQFKVMTAMLQNMFPSIDVQTMQLSHARRVLLFNYNEETGNIDMRQYCISVKTTGVSKSVKRVINTSLPDLSNFEDISDYVLREAVVSESDVEDGPDSVVTLSQNMGRNNLKNDQRAVRLQELGPRMTLELVKVENGLCNGEVLYHRFVTKTKEEMKESERKRQRTKSEKAARRQQQESNVERKKKEKEEHRVRTGGAPREDEDAADDMEDTLDADEENEDMEDQTFSAEEGDMEEEGEEED